MSGNDQFVVPNEVPYVKLEAKEAFNGLENNQKLYAYWLSKASWEGSKICLFQISHESPVIFLLFQHLFSYPLEDLKTAVKDVGISSEEFDTFLTYAAAFYGNMGNYKSFGDTKIIPGINKKNFKSIIKASQAYTDFSEYTKTLLLACLDDIYSLDSNVQQFGFSPDSYTSYYSFNVTRADAELVQRYLTKKGIPAWNTRIFKTLNAEKVEQLEIRLASSVEDTTQEFEKFEGVQVRIVTGDYTPVLSKVVEYLEEAKNYGNDLQKQMIEKYIESFKTGSVDAHKDASRIWVQDISPPVESYIGFIETYRDPLGVRAEWEGFVAVVNAEETVKFGALVDNAPPLLSKLPWPKEFEKSKFERPDFTSLDVVSFGSSGVPAGINIPNYDEIRQNGFKNVSLGNVLSASLKQDKVTFLSKSDEALFIKYASDAFKVQVGLHELLGHGSGKLFMEDSNGELNFEKNAVKLPFLGDDRTVNIPIETWYKPGETYDSKFPVFGSSYEECRAECVGIYLCIEQEVMNIFGHTDTQVASDIMYTNWLMMARAGLVALEFFRPNTGSWGQAHMQARYAILQVMLEGDIGLVTIEKDPELGLKVSLDRTKIKTHGHHAIGEFLKKLQVYKATADYDHAKKLYDKYTFVPDLFLEYRELVLKYKKPRRLLVQPELILTSNNEVNIVEFENSAEGMINSFQQRFPSTRSNDETHSTMSEPDLYTFWKQIKGYTEHRAIQKN